MWRGERERKKKNVCVIKHVGHPLKHRDRVRVIELSHPPFLLFECQFWCRVEILFLLPPPTNETNQKLDEECIGNAGRLFPRDSCYRKSGRGGVTPPNVKKKKFDSFYCALFAFFPPSPLVFHVLHETFDTPIIGCRVPFSSFISISILFWNLFDFFPFADCLFSLL